MVEPFSSGVGMKIWTCYDNLPAQSWNYTSDNRMKLANQGAFNFKDQFSRVLIVRRLQPTALTLLRVAWQTLTSSKHGSATAETPTKCGLLRPPEAQTILTAPKRITSCCVLDFLLSFEYL